MDIRKQFSLDWLAGDQPTRGSQDRSLTIADSPTRSALNEAVVFYSQPIIKRLMDVPDKRMRVHDLVHAVDTEVPVKSFEEFAGVINYLADLGIIQIVEKDITGNDLVQLLKTR